MRILDQLNYTVHQRTHHLTESTIEANKRFFEKEEDVTATLIQ